MWVVGPQWRMKEQKEARTSGWRLMSDRVLKRAGCAGIGKDRREAVRV
jgi:hypothetical protein